MAVEMTVKPGVVIQVIGPVVDVEFEGGKLPAIYNAVRITGKSSADSDPIDIVCEVEQHIGENRVRAIAMKRTDGLQRGMQVEDLGLAHFGAGGAADARAGAERAGRAGGFSKPAGRDR